MPWLSGLQVVSVEEVGGCRRIIKKIDHVLLYCIVVILLKGGQKGYTRQCRLAVPYDKEKQPLNI